MVVSQSFLIAVADLDWPCLARLADILFEKKNPLFGYNFFQSVEPR